MRTWHGFIQGFNAQASVSDDQIVLATDVVTDANDSAQLAPMLAATLAALRAAGIDDPIQDPIQTLLADTGYWNPDTIDDLNTVHDTGAGPRALVPPDRAALRPEPGDHDPRREHTRAAAMRTLLRTGDQRARYRRRQATVEPVFGQLKARISDRFSGRGLSAARAEFALMALAHNMLKLHAATT